MESPGEYSRGQLCLILVSFVPPSRALVAYHQEKGGMPLREAVGVNCITAQLNDIKAQVTSIGATGCTYSG